jgi:methionine synthase I (cobalamin-dependent)
VYVAELGWGLEDLLKERIVIIDGAMGTMIQKEKLLEADFRFHNNASLFFMFFLVQVSRRALNDLFS